MAVKSNAWLVTTVGACILPGVYRGNINIKHPVAYCHVVRKMANDVRETFRWHWRSASCPPCPLPEECRELCPCFTLSEAEEAARDFDLPKMVQATFYAMLFSDAIELVIASGFIAAELKGSLEGLRCTLFESWMHVNRHGLLEAQLRQRTLPSEYVQDIFCWPLRESSALRPNLLPVDHHGLFLSFDLGVVTQYAHNYNILEMVHAIFYAMVLNDVVKLGLGSRLSRDCMMWVLQKLDWAPLKSWLGNIENRLPKPPAL
ncbi:hypothetical protein Cgig2_003834 [Carnegiea gigantea]|uniref:Uncharacterized protein n=1 Tax=Carnegiea gigantea TaxID=171969 RepID=A0A9Q1JU40_9CARY|nr:hypothetical protein Cgig2_003834 [Carnegiea gigantea]